MIRQPCGRPGAAGGNAEGVSKFIGRSAVDIRLVEIGQDGHVAEPLTLPDVALSVCEATAAMYRKAGFLRLWIGYLVVRDSQVVGSCNIEETPLLAMNGNIK